MWDFQIKEVLYSDLTELRRRSKTSPTVGFRDTKRTVWFAVDVDNELVGCGAIISVKEDFVVARLKSGYVLPEWRGQQFGLALLEHRLKWCAATPQCNEIQVITINPPLFASYGFEPMTGARPGEMRKRLKQ